MGKNKQRPVAGTPQPQVPQTGAALQSPTMPLPAEFSFAEPQSNWRFFGHAEVPDGHYTVSDDGRYLIKTADFTEKELSDLTSPPQTETQTSSTPEDAAQLAEHEGFPIYEEELNFCLTMAFMHTGADVICEWDDIPFRIANFMLLNPDAPVEAALIEIKMRKKVVVLPNFDQRRVQLALTLFRAYVLGWHAIEREDVAKTIAADEAARYAARPPQKLDLTDTPYETVSGPFDASDLGKGR
jgi:hypothetical protein